MPRARGQLKKVKKSDYERVLITDTLPFETPLIFSNDGFYINSVGRKDITDPIFNLIFSFLIESPVKDGAIPYTYKIKKSFLEFRRLALLHPASQWEIKEFYRKYEKLICHFCSQSQISIRAPQKVASSFYYKSTWANVNQYRTGDILSLPDDRLAKHSSSFFAYRGYDRLYKFFNSGDFFSLEKQFSQMWTLDVSKCFDSIYTHSMGWATKSKEFVKKHVKVSTTFGQKFDSLMQGANHKETNGIVIGPEVSRVFAEIIFQSVDADAINTLRDKFEYELGREFELRRYVDDLFIFAQSDEIAQRVFEIYADQLIKFNLHVNASKTQKFKRPFLTKKSRVIRAVNIEVNEFIEKFIDVNEFENKFEPKAIHFKQRLVRSFVETIKSICSFNEGGYDDVSSYIISAFFERVKKLINVDLTKASQDEVGRYKDASLVFLEIIYFFYSAAPSVSASYKLCASIILLNRFAEKNLGVYEGTIKQRIFELSTDLLETELFYVKSGVENFVSLEAINVLLGISELGDGYLLPEETVGRIFEGREFRYYDIISCLFYMRDCVKYAQLREAVIVAIDKLLTDMSNIKQSSEKACLFLDALCCPYIPRAKKIKWLKRFFKVKKGAFPARPIVDAFLILCASNYWFVNWGEVDLLNTLERKELKSVY